MTSDMSIPNLAQLHQAIAITEQIESLQAELANLMAGSDQPTSAAGSAPTAKGGKRKMSAATIAKMRASQQARWSKRINVVPPLDTLLKAPAVKPAKVKAKRTMSPEGRARIVAALKARWAAKKKADK